MEQEMLLRTIAKVLDDKKALDIRAFRVGHLTVITDYMLLASGRNILQTKALAEDVEDKMAELGVPLRTREGSQEGRWIVLDYGTVLVHIFHPEDRQFYHLERLWEDGQNRVPLPFLEEGNEEKPQA